MNVISVFRRSGRHSRAADPFEDEGEDETVLYPARGGHHTAPLPRVVVPEVAHERPVPPPGLRETADKTIPWDLLRPRIPECRCDLCLWAIEVADGYNGPCRCDEHKYGQRPAVRAVLYSGPDAMWLFERAAVRDGRYEDADAYADDAEARIRARLDAADRRTRRTIERGYQRALAATGRRAA